MNIKKGVEFMNNSYYQNPMYSNQGRLPNQQAMPKYDTIGNPNAMYNSSIGSDEQSYIENILRLNRGKRAQFHVTVPGSVEWQDRVFDGIIEQSGKDHIIVSNPNTGEWYLVLMIYLDFVTFDEPINYKMEYSIPPTV